MRLAGKAGRPNARPTNKNMMGRGAIEPAQRLETAGDEPLQQRLRVIFFSPATPADNDTGRIASLGEGPHIGQRVPALFLREADIPRRHVWFAVMDGLEQLGIGFLSGRR